MYRRRAAAILVFCAFFAGAAWVGVEIAERAGLQVGFSDWQRLERPSFALSDHNGRAVTNETFEGRPLLVYFGYTYCPDICPTHLSEILVTLDRLGDLGRRVQPVFVTIDPERDTLQQMQAYVNSFDSRLIGLTGTTEQIAAASRSFGVSYRKVEGRDGGPYVMDHSALTYLIGGDGRFLGTLTPGMSPRTMARKVRRLLPAEPG